jgi:hypothetical protein
MFLVDLFLSVDMFFIWFLKLDGIECYSEKIRMLT